MYSRANYSQFGQGSPASLPPFPQGFPASQPYTVQQGPPSIPSSISYSSPFTYQHARHPPVPQDMPAQVSTSGVLNADQAYLCLPPPPPQCRPQQGHGSATATYSYTTDQQNSQWIQNMPCNPQPIPPPPGLPPGISCSEMFQPLVLPRVLPSLPTQQTPFRGPTHIPLPGSMRGTQQIPLSPPVPPYASSFFIPAPFGSFVTSMHRDSSATAITSAPSSPPPPLPSSSPPLSPPPPPPTSPLPSPPLLTTSFPCNSKSGTTSNRSGIEVMSPDSEDKVVVTTQSRDNTPAHDDYKNPDGRSSCEEGSHTEEDLSSVEGTNLEIPPPPPKLTEEKVEEEIESLCISILKNDPGFEDNVREKARGNQEFDFLFGGKPGSPSDMEISTKSTGLMGASVSLPPFDSDLDMEDDITQPDDEQRASSSFEGLKTLNREPVLIPEALDIEKRRSLSKDAISVSLGLAEQEKGSKITPELNHSTYGRSLSIFDSPLTKSAGAAECPSNSNLENSSVPHLEVISQSNLSAAVSGVDPEKFPGELPRGASPFRLLQDYASDDDSEDNDKPCLEDVIPLTGSPLTTTGATSLQRVIGSNLPTAPGSRSLSSSCSEPFVATSRSTLSNAVEFLVESQRNARAANLTSLTTVNHEELVHTNNRNQEIGISAVCLEALQRKHASDGVHDTAPRSGKSQLQKENFNYASTLSKVDEFGRLVREGAIDSDSEDSGYTGRRSKRGRSWSRSRSPYDRGSHPRRRKEKRSRSRSWSPKRRNSRSRSPSYRHVGESDGDQTRRDKGKLPECFNFLRGRCHRGAFCRYMHHGSNKSDSGRCYRIRQQYAEGPPVSRTKDFEEDFKQAPLKRSVHELVIPGNSFRALSDGMAGEKVSLAVQDTMQTLISFQDDISLNTDGAKSERSREVTATMQETRDSKEEILKSTTDLRDDENGMETLDMVNENGLDMAETVQPVFGSSSCLLTDAGAPKSPGDHDTAQGTASLIENMVIPESQTNASLSVLDNASHEPRDADSSYYNSQLPPPPLSVSQDTSTPPLPQLPMEMKLPTTTATSMGNCSPYHALLENQHSHVSVPPNASWYPPPLPLPLPLPPGPPFVNNVTGTAVPNLQVVRSFHFEHNQLPPRNDFTSQTFVRPYPGEMAANSQASEFQHRSYPLLQEREPPQPSLHTEDFRPNPQPMGNPKSQPVGSIGLVGGDHFFRYQGQASHHPSLFALENIPLQPLHSLKDLETRRMQPFQDENLSSDIFSTSFSQNHPYSQQHPPLRGPSQSAADGHIVNVGDSANIPSTMSRYTSDLIDRNQPSHLFDFGRSRISNHYNPYASTFDQPLRSKFSSNFFKQEKDLPYSSPCDAFDNMNHLPVDGQGVGSLGSRHVTSSPKSSLPVDLLRSGSDQYDPLFDSIEPSSNSFKNFDHGHELEPTLRFSSSRKPLDVEETNKQKEVEAVAVTTSIKSEYDEFGETEDAEVGGVDNLSASNLRDEANAIVGEIEIDEVKMPGKSKKSKDSRSMKLFKVALTDFIKVVLKPYWRQGTMSKEAFKTIVKKTVDRVSGAMKSHQIPKSQAKINRYLDSSERKLTKLVMGYFHKHSKV